MNIILIGFMGSGKSSVAALLSQKLKCSHKETDALVLSRSKRKSIKELFARDGEVRFRELEIRVAKKLNAKKDSIISTGGGMIMNKICIDYLKQNGTVIYLSTSFKEIEKRLEGDTTRPLFTDKLAAKKLFQFRKNLYETYADMTVVTDGKSVDEVANIILNTYENSTN